MRIETTRCSFCWGIILSTAMLTSCNSAPQLQIVFPPGFGGAILIYEDPDVPAISETAQGAVVPIPASGLLAVRSLHPFEKLMEYRLVRPDGTSAPVLSVNDQPPSRQGLWMYGGKTINGTAGVQFWYGRLDQSNDPAFEALWKQVRQARVSSAGSDKSGQD